MQSAHAELRVRGPAAQQGFPDQVRAGWYSADTAGNYAHHARAVSLWYDQHRFPADAVPRPPTDDDNAAAASSVGVSYHNLCLRTELVVGVAIHRRDTNTYIHAYIHTHSLLMEYQFHIEQKNLIKGVFRYFDIRHNSNVQKKRQE